jgi:hypothetical protein
VQIHDQDLGLKFAGEANGFSEIAGFANDLQVRFAVEKAANGLSNNSESSARRILTGKGLVEMSQKRDNNPLFGNVKKCSQRRAERSGGAELPTRALLTFMVAQRE